MPMDRKAIGSAAGTAIVVAAVAGIGLWARRQPAEVPLRIEPLPTAESANRSSRAEAPAPESDPTTDRSSPTAASGPKKFAVDIEGAVRNPGLYWVNSDERVADLLRRAGGTTPDGDASGLNLAQPLKDGMKVTVPFAASGPAKGDPLPPSSEPAPPASEPAADPQPGRPSGSTRGAHKGDDLAPASISINRASAAEWQRLPGVGPSTAQKILAERDRKGGFQAVDDLLDVPGIGPKKLEKMRPYLTL